MGREAKYPTPEKSQDAVAPLKGDRKMPGDDIDFLSLFAIAFTAVGTYKLEPAYGLISLFLLLSISINQKPKAPFLSNAKISFVICIFCVYMIYSKMRLLPSKAEAV